MSDIVIKQSNMLKTPEVCRRADKLIAQYAQYVESSQWNDNILTITGKHFIGSAVIDPGLITLDIELRTPIAKVFKNTIKGQVQDRLHDMLQV